MDRIWNASMTALPSRVSSEQSPNATPTPLPPTACITGSRSGDHKMPEAGISPASLSTSRYSALAEGESDCLVDCLAIVTTH